MNDFSRFNDGSANAPALRVHHALWSLIGLPFNCTADDRPEWTLDEKFSRVQENGFAGVECWLDDSNEAEVKGALDQNRLRLVLGHRPFSLDDVRATVERAVRLGADFVFAQPASAFTPFEDVVKIVVEGRKVANDAGLSFFVETHRNNWTENLPQTLQLIQAVPDIRFTADLSHFVVVGEFYGWEAEGADERLAPILERASHAHARISNGEAVQVDVGDGSNDTAQFFVRMWARMLKSWRAEARAGDVFPFASELGPPRYAITDRSGREISDRWEQSLVMKRLIEEAWEKSGS